AKEPVKENQQQGLPAAGAVKLKSISLSIPLLLLSIGSLSIPSMAGHVMAESIWNQNHALELAKSRVPRGSEITEQSCLLLQVTNTDRYRCKVVYNP
ncbi:MAG: hypothetical protein AB8E74_09010, partial [Prochlorococcus sp.]